MVIQKHPFFNIEKIVVHGGTSAHRDEIYACALVQGWRVMNRYQPVIIERRNPAEEELDDRNVLVIDVGRYHDTERHNFDHHQFPAGEENPSAFELVARYMFPEDTDLFSYFKAIEPLVVAISRLDNYGPIVLKKEYGEHVFLLSGIELSMMERWVDDHNGVTGEIFTGWMASLLERSEKLAIRYKTLDREARFLSDDLVVIDQPIATDGFPESFGVPEWLQRRGKKPLIVIGWDRDRNTDHLIVKVSRLEAGELAGVDLNGLSVYESSWRFIHNNGFVAFGKPGVTQDMVINQVTALLEQFYQI